MGEALDNPETIGRRLRRLRTERGLSQRELASPGVSYAYISRIEAGTRQPSVKALRKLARKLGVTPEYLETGSEVRETELRELRLAQAELELRLSDDRPAAEQALRGLLAEAQEAGDVIVARRAQIAVGLAAFESGRTQEAADLLGRAVAEGDLSPRLRPDVFGTLGRAYAMLGAADRAARLFADCLAEIESDDPVDTTARIRFATYLSFALTDMGEVDRAEATLRDVLGDVETFADPYSQVRIYWSLGRLAGVQGRPTEALDNLRKAIALLEATEDTVHLARAHLSCAWSLISNERADEAGPYLEAAERLFGANPTKADLAALRAEQARRAVALGQGEAAVGFAREALELTGDAFVEEQGTAYLALAEGLALQGETAGANDAFRRSVGLFEQAGKPQDAAQAYRSWGRVLREAGRESDALDALERAADLAVRAPAETS